MIAPFALPARELRTAVLDLPVPPSVNRTRKVDWAGRALVAKWKLAANGLVMATPKKDRPKIPGRFDLQVFLSEDHTGIDLDNGIKCLIDHLRHIEIITNDSPKYMRKLTVEWGLAPEGCRVIVTELA